MFKKFLLISFFVLQLLSAKEEHFIINNTNTHMHENSHGIKYGHTHSHTEVQQILFHETLNKKEENLLKLSIFLKDIQLPKNLLLNRIFRPPINL